ncbi:hypothetical protein D3C81_2124620 [compost metagenome]
MTQAQRRVVAGDDLPGGQFQHFQRGFLRQAGETATAEHDVTAKATAGQGFHLGLQRFTQFSTALDHLRQRLLGCIQGIGA